MALDSWSVFGCSQISANSRFVMHVTNKSRICNCGFCCEYNWQRLVLYLFIMLVIDSFVYLVSDTNCWKYLHVILTIAFTNYFKVELGTSRPRHGLQDCSFRHLIKQDLHGMPTQPNIAPVWFLSTHWGQVMHIFVSKLRHGWFKY